MAPEHRDCSARVVAEVRRAVESFDLAGQRVLAAVSGGVDSTVLAHILGGLAPRLGFRLCLGHVNHGLRGPESEADEHFVRALAEALDVPCATRRVDPGRRRAGCSSLERPTLQEAARELRYAALEEMSRALEADRIATAHHADDQAETVLLRLFRGSGPDGLGGIPACSPDGRIVRPLLRVSRNQVEAFARVRGIPWREDRTNAEADYARNRLRRDWLPGLAADFNPRLLRAIGDLAEAQRRDSDWIRGQVERHAASHFSVEGAWLRIEPKDWSEMPEALARRLAREALGRCGVGRLVTRVHLERMVAFLRTAQRGKRIELPGDLILVRDRRGFRLGALRGSAPVPSDGAC